MIPSLLRCFPVVALLGVFIAPLQAQVVLERRPDGSVVITNQGRASVPTATSVTEAPPVAPAGASVPRSAASTPLHSWIRSYSQANRLDEKLVMAVISAESSWNPRALSEKGAMGLMQLMPATAAELGIDDPWDPESNVRGGTRYLRMMLDRFQDDLELALAAYNAGPGAVERNGGIPPYRETRTYVRRVLGAYRGGEVRLGDGRIASTRPIQVRTDVEGRLVISTPRER